VGNATVTVQGVAMLAGQIIAKLARRTSCTRQS
jgi:hypothetical protein